MKRVASILAVAAAALVIGLGAGLGAAAKSYQFTGKVTAADSGTLTVQKSAKETWVFSTSKDTKGAAKVGDSVTVYYTMVANEIEAKAAPAAKKPAK